jgi:hypothetical protein
LSRVRRMKSVGKVNCAKGSFSPDYIREHNRRVKETIPKERLLVMKLGKGWGPLCKFLGKPIPENEPFPRLNDAEYADKMAMSIVTGLVVRWAFILVTTAAVPFASYWVYKNYGQ